MRPAFEELDYRPTPLGALSLRRRRDPATGADVFEVKLGDAWRLGLAASGGRDLAVVGGLGLGYTAAAVLEEARVAPLLVVELFVPVIDWHRRHLVPRGETLTRDPRCRLVQGDFFALAAGAARLATTFATARAEPVTFDNPLQGRPVTQTVYLAEAP